VGGSVGAGLLAAVLMRLLSTLLILACLASAAAAQDAAAAWAALRAGGHVALIRHAGTVGGSGDPPEFRLEDCATQRNLTLKGRAEARRLGELFRSGGVSVGKVLSSQWCRCLDTVALMGLGTPHWDYGARGTLLGLTRGSGRPQLCSFDSSFKLCSFGRRIEAAPPDSVEP